MENEKEILNMINQLDKQDFELSSDIKLLFDEIKNIEGKNDISKVESEINSIKENIDTISLQKGDKGDKGEKGKDGKNGKDGKDGRDGVDGLDGKDGENGKDGSPDTPEQIVEKINTLEQVIERKTIKGFESVIDKQELERALGILDQRTQYLINKKTSSFDPAILNAKKNIATGNAYKFETTDIDGNLQETTVAPSRAVVTDSNGLPSASTTTASEIEFVSGVTSPIQTQLDSKISTIKGSIAITIDGQGGVITTGFKGSMVVPFSGTITGWQIFETSSTPISSSIVVDVWKNTYNNYPETVADAIFTTKPTLTGATKNQNLTPTFIGSGATVTAGDIIGFNVDSSVSAVRVVAVLLINKSS